MRILLDTASLSEIAHACEMYPIVGVTTNPTILSKEGGDVVALLCEIRKILGSDLELHVQVTEHECEKIVEEAEAIVALLGKNTFVKIPVTEDGLKATRILKEKNIPVTATAILTATQALLMAEAGARYTAPYVSRLENIMADGIGTVSEIAEIFANGGYETEILAASFKTGRQVLDTALAGAHSVTVSPDILRLLVAHPVTTSSIAGFDRDFAGAFGNKTLLEILKEQKA